MKQIFIALSLLLCISVNCQASDMVDEEPETTTPIHGTEIERYCTLMDIEHKIYADVKVIIKSNDPDYVWTTKHKVYFKVIDSEGNVVYKKTFKNAYLYVFRSGQIQIGKKNFDQVVIRKSESSEDWLGIIREKEGVF